MAGLRNQGIDETLLREVPVNTTLRQATIPVPRFYPPNLVRGNRTETQTDEQTARLSFLYELLEYVRSQEFMPSFPFPGPGGDPDDEIGYGNGESLKPQSDFAVIVAGNSTDNETLSEGADS